MSLAYQKLYDRIGFPEWQGLPEPNMLDGTRSDLDNAIQFLDEWDTLPTCNRWYCVYGFMSLTLINNLLTPGDICELEHYETTGILCYKTWLKFSRMVARDSRQGLSL
jgi:hypothetical protein